jgi:hypothetical protein
VLRAFSSSIPPWKSGGRKSPNTLEWNKSSLYVDDRLDFLKGLETDTLKGFWMGKGFFS